MKRLGRLSTASLLTVLPLLSLTSAAGAEPAPPAAYAAVARAYPLFWDGYSGISVNEELRVPYIAGVTNHAPFSRAEAALALPDLSVKTMTGEAIQGLACKGYEAKRCRDPFLPEAEVSHSSSDPVSARQLASFLGRSGQNPGHIDAVNSCEGDCGRQLIRTTAEAVAPAGAIPNMISVGSSSARQDVTVDEAGRVVGIATSELRGVAIGPNREVTFSRLTSTARAVGAGAENAKDGQGTVDVADMVVLGNPVELTGAGLKLSHGAISEQEAYDGAKALLAKLRQDHGISLEFGDQADDILREAAQVTVRVNALRVRFDPRVQAPQTVGERIEQVMSLGSSTMVVMAFEQERQIDVSYEGDDVVVQAQPEAQATATPSSGAPAPAPSASTGPTPSTGAPSKATPAGSPPPRLPSNAQVKVKVTPPRPAPAPATPVPAPGPATPTPEVSGDQGTLPPPAVAEVPLPSTAGPDGFEGLDEEAFGIGDIGRGLKDARAVSRAFGAFLALGLVLPLARFVIKRFG